jgi:hypothetical protein
VTLPLRSVSLLVSGLVALSVVVATLATGTPGPPGRAAMGPVGFVTDVRTPLAVLVSKSASVWLEAFLTVVRRTPVCGVE